LAVNTADALIYAGDIFGNVILISGGSGGGPITGGASSNYVAVIQNSHGFTTGEALYYTGSTYDRAISNDSEKLGIGIAVVTGANTAI
jgi:hypothetical protein